MVIPPTHFGGALAGARLSKISQNTQPVKSAAQQLGDEAGASAAVRQPVAEPSAIQKLRDRVPPPRPEPSVTRQLSKEVNSPSIDQLRNAPAAQPSGIDKLRDKAAELQLEPRPSFADKLRKEPAPESSVTRQLGREVNGFAPTPSENGLTAGATLRKSLDRHPGSAPSPASSADETVSALTAILQNLSPESPEAQRIQARIAAIQQSSNPAPQADVLSLLPPWNTQPEPSKSKGEIFTSIFQLLQMFISGKLSGR